MAHEFAKSDGTRICEGCLGSSSGDCPDHPHIGGARLDDFLRDVEMEVYRARLLYPGSEGVGYAVGEEVGEVFRAYLTEPRARVIKEAVQACAMLIQLALGGDPALAAMRNRRGLNP